MASKVAMSEKGGVSARERLCHRPEGSSFSGTFSPRLFGGAFLKRAKGVQGLTPLVGEGGFEPPQHEGA